jgi:CDP-glycerol glycerophosphotransferase (TagB/SpsB family)
VSKSLFWGSGFYLLRSSTRTDAKKRGFTISQKRDFRVTDSPRRVIRLAIRLIALPALFAVVSVVTRRYPQTVLFASASGAEMTGNFLAVSSYLNEHHPEIKIVEELQLSLSSRQTMAQKLRRYRNIASAGTIVLNDYYPTIHSIRLKKRTALVQLWHAPGAFKRFGLSRKGLPGGPRPGSGVHTGYALSIASSADVQPCVQEAFGMSSDRVLPLGIPKTDIYFDQAVMKRFNTEVRIRLGVDANHRLVLFTPTFRGNGQRSAHHEIDYPMWSRIAAVAGANVTVLIRNHPFVHESAPDSVYPNVVDVSQGYDIEELLAAADMLVTDYSSAIFDFALLEKPMALYCPDTDSYERSRGFYFPLEHYAWGPIVDDEAKLTVAVQRAELDMTALLAVREKFMSACDGQSTERVVNAILAVKPLRP